jgi:hypothetical protein
MRKPQLRAIACVVGLFSVATLALVAPASADITVMKAEYAAGVTVIRGETERSFAEVTLDRRFSTTANRFGEFEFRLRYLPDDCTVSLRAGRDTRPVTINNCFSSQRHQAHAADSALKRAELLRADRRWPPAACFGPSSENTAKRLPCGCTSTASGEQKISTRWSAYPPSGGPSDDTHLVSRLANQFK